MTDAELFKLATRCKPPNPHLWPACDDFKSMPPNPLLGRAQQTERTCPKCHLVKITVHPEDGGGYRLWRWGDGGCQFADRVEPECVVVVREEAKVAG